MQKLAIDLENCYGIEKLQTIFDFTKCSAYAIYAPNGSMKSSLARTFQDIRDDRDSKDCVFPHRKTRRVVRDGTGQSLDKEKVLVVRPYDETFSNSEKTSTLLVNSTLREEYEKLHAEIDEATEKLVKALEVQSGLRNQVGPEISALFTKKEDQLLRALTRIRDEVDEMEFAPFAEIPYKLVFSDRVLAFLSTKGFKAALSDYVKQYNSLLDNSTYFAKGVFDFYNASSIAKTLEKNGFFEARHTVRLNAGECVEITSKEQLEELVTAEKESILNNPDLKKSFLKIEAALSKNSELRAFQEFISNHEELLPELENVDNFKEKVWKSYIWENRDLYHDLLSKDAKAKDRKHKIEEQARKEQTQWERVIEIFNSRFFVPFTLVAKNRTEVILGQQEVLQLAFIFKDRGEEADVSRDELLAVLSTGEKKALYILNLIFEIEARRKTNQDTVLIVDDVADSFDYKNKYAIIEYLKEIATWPNFRQVILTHNFDFFRTVQSRFVNYSCCLMGSRDSTGVNLAKAAGIQNVFVKDWKKNYQSDPKKRIACIPFMRNLIEFTRGETDSDYLTLTSLLHWKSDTCSIDQAELDRIFNALFGAAVSSPDPTKIVVDLIEEQAGQCVNAAAGANFENKIVLSIAVRLKSEKFMVNKINDSAFCSSIAKNQTFRLIARLEKDSLCDAATIDLLKRVNLMTPENIHLNSFMYEPILDMSDEHLKKLHDDLGQLC